MKNAVVIEERWPTVGYGGLTEYTTMEPSGKTTESGDFTLRGSVVTGYHGKGGDIVLPDGVTAVGARAFAQNITITGVTVPQTLRGIGESAFEGCTALRQVSALPDGLLRVCAKAFKGCTSLVSFDMAYFTGADRTAFEESPYAETNGHPRQLENAFAATRKYAGQCSDVTTGAWHYRFFIRVYEVGLLGAKSDGHFQPDGTLSVAEAMQIAATTHARCTGNTARLQTTEPWQQTYYDYMARYTGLDMAEWQDASRPIRRNEFACLLVNSLPGNTWAHYRFTLNDGSFPDMRVQNGDNWDQLPCFNEVEALYHAGVCDRYADGKFHPERNITRAEAAVMIARAIDPALRLPEKMG